MTADTKEVLTMNPTCISCNVEVEEGADICETCFDQFSIRKIMETFMKNNKEQEQVQEQIE